ncbi:acyl-CoA N-acyltransferase [Schizothecium vesticola]|uniref:Acyl-CoA N-acyltransferase n=1 Tax=Schizothecium vesticola TaxID=314040 RepID=A0AA40K368_9PEZI|nr:acyl-CoA N-acyltransferase [Schizothecium vesticola]
MASWRAMIADDIPQVAQVADQIHPNLPEGDFVFSERIRLFPEGCLILSQGSRVLGYAVSHPIRHAQPPALDSLLGEIPTDADQYYIHDVAILPELRGQGHATEGIRKLLDVGSRFASTCLVSVYGTGPFWRRFGFREEEVEDALREKLRNYGDDAVFMSRRNDASPQN